MTEHKVTGEVIQYWLQRGEAVAARLSDHGVPARCQLGTTVIDDRLTYVLDFDFSKFGMIMVAELIADQLDELSAEVNRKLGGGDGEAGSVLRAQADDGEGVAGA